MKASVGDMIEVRRSHDDDLPRRGEVLEVRGKDGGPPFLIHWDDNPHVSIYFPGNDAVVHHFEHAAEASHAGGA